MANDGEIRIEFPEPREHVSQVIQQETGFNVEIGQPSQGQSDQPTGEGEHDQASTVKTKHNRTVHDAEARKLAQFMEKEIFDTPMGMPDLMVQKVQRTAQHFARQLLERTTYRKLTRGARRTLPRISKMRREEATGCNLELPPSMYTDWEELLRDEMNQEQSAPSEP
ncbi:hypothetical protein KP509_15G012400 [Ceratopteris richardii]|uniref:Uncharacterized protein n=1 Tax=Ceratopteris richardii TaxID=49495 RepID=A0A8T2T148_CERRI|nr:hypothetical protein KP509_15G012400 [Ceratopteris richardii]